MAKRKPTGGASTGRSVDAPRGQHHDRSSLQKLSPSDARAIRALAQLQSNRAFTPRDVSIESVVNRLKREATSKGRSLGRYAELWRRHMPPEVVSKTTLTSFRSGVLHVAADDSAVLYRVDRLLRGGLEATIRSGAPGTLRRIKVSIEQASPGG